MDWGKYGYVIASRYRQRIVLSLHKGPKTPKQIADETKFYLSHVSLVIKKLVERKIVNCLTPNLRRGKIFTLTDEGKEIAEKLERMG